MTEYSDYSSSDTEDINETNNIITYEMEDKQYNSINQLLNAVNEFKQSENPLILDQMTPLIFHRFIEHIQSN